MSGLTLRLKTAPALRIDLRRLTPVALSGLSASEVAALPLWHGRERIAVGDLFDIAAHTVDGDIASLVFEGDLTRFDRIGWNMESGELRVEGSVGDYAGCGMAGGTLAVNGRAGDFTGAVMRGGTLSIASHTGDFAAASLPGDMEGMRGGTFTVGGNAGERLGDRMRRGTVLVSGNAGMFAASRMVAGTIGIGGAIGMHLAFGMRRGTVVLATATPALSPTFVDTDHNFAVFWALLARSLARTSSAFEGLAARAPQRTVGDLAVEGKGEILSFTR